MSINLVIKIQIIMFFFGLMFLPQNVWAIDDKPVRITSQDVEQAISLKKREDSVAAREREIELRASELNEVKKDVDEKLARLVDLQNDVKRQLEDLKAAQTSEFKNLVKVYSSMSTSKVAPILDKLEVSSIVKIFRSMKADQVAQIMPKMDREKVVEVSKSMGLMDSNF